MPSRIGAGISGFLQGFSEVYTKEMAHQQDEELRSKRSFQQTLIDAAKDDVDRGDLEGLSNPDVVKAWKGAFGNDAENLLPMFQHMATMKRNTPEFQVKEQIEKSLLGAFGGGGGASAAESGGAPAAAPASGAPAASGGFMGVPGLSPLAAAMSYATDGGKSLGAMIQAAPGHALQQETLTEKLQDRPAAIEKRNLDIENAKLTQQKLQSEIASEPLRKQKLQSEITASNLLSQERYNKIASAPEPTSALEDDYSKRFLAIDKDLKLDKNDKTNISPENAAATIDTHNEALRRDLQKLVTARKITADEAEEFFKSNVRMLATKDGTEHKVLTQKQLKAYVAEARRGKEKVSVLTRDVTPQQATGTLQLSPEEHKQLRGW